MSADMVSCSRFRITGSQTPAEIQTAGFKHPICLPFVGLCPAHRSDPIESRLFISWKSDPMRTVKTAGETAQAAMAATDTGARAPGATESNYARKWREAHKEKIAAYARIYRASHPLLMKWKGMLMRTGLTSDTTPGNIKHYIDRGIAVCDEWRLFKNFESWAMANGWKPGLEIDRIDNNGNYEPGNCRFVSRVENIRNRRNTVRVFYNGRIMPLAEAFEMSGCKLSYRLVLKRVTQGIWPVEKALTLPARFMRRMDRHSDATAKNEDGGMSGATFLVYALCNGAFKACASYSAFARAKGYADELAAFVEKRGLGKSIHIGRIVPCYTASKKGGAA